METKTKNYVIGVLVSTMLVVGFWSAFYPQRAYAQTFQVITGFAYPVVAMHYQAENDLIWVLTGNFTTSHSILYWVDRSTLSVIGSANHTNAVSGGVGNKAFDIWCGKTDCYITTASATSGTNGQILRVSTETLAPDIFRGMNVTGTYTHTDQLYHITGRDQVNGGFGSVTLWVDACSIASGSGCADDLHIVDGISMLFVGELQNYGITNNDWRAKDLQWSGIEGITDNHLASTHSSHLTGITSSKLYITNLATITTHCSVTTPNISAVASMAISVATNYVSAGSANNKVYVGTNAGHVFVYNDDCTLLQTIDGTETGISGNVRYLEYSGGRVFMQSDGISAPIVQMLTNSTGHIIETDKTTYLPLPSSSQQLFDSISGRSTVGDMILFSGFGKLWFPYTGSDKKVGILTYDEEEEEESGGGGNAVNGRCGVGTVLDCIGDRSVGLAVTGGSDITTVSETLFCGIGFNTTCSGDPKENGTGLLLMLITGVFFSGIVIISIATANTRFGAGIAYTEIPKELWLFLVVGVVALSFYFQWIPDIVFYGMMVGLAGLFSFGLYKHIRGG